MELRLKKHEFLRLATISGRPRFKAWMISAFSVFRPNANAKFQTYDIRPEPWGYSFLNLQGEWEKLDDAVANEPLFKANERIKIDNTWIESATEPGETSIGTYLFNSLVMMPSFGKKFPYVFGKISIKQIESVVAPRLKDTPKPGEERSDQFFYCDENIRFRDALQYISDMSMLFCWSATAKAITPADGIEEFKKNLMETTYKGKLNDPVEYAKFEAELLAFDKAYLKGDPCFEFFMNKKITDNSRKKLYLTIGAEEGFDQTGQITPVFNSLSEGWPTDPKQITAINNSSRLGSYSRGVETISGGVTAKALLRAANNYEIVDQDCMTRLGKIKSIEDDQDVEYLVGRKIFTGQLTTHIQTKEEAGKYLGKAVIVRSPQYCKSPGETLCQYCVGAPLSQYKTGLAIPLMEMSAIVLASSMAKMHAASITLVELDLQEALS